MPRQGYQFVAPVTAVEAPEAAVDLELLLAPHPAWAEGVALESLQVHRIASARDTFQRLVQQHPADAGYQIGMAYACAMLFEATRTDPAPDAEALRLAETACAARLCARPAAGRGLGHAGLRARTHPPARRCAGRARAGGGARARQLAPSGTAGAGQLGRNTAAGGAAGAGAMSAVAAGVLAGGHRVRGQERARPGRAGCRLRAGGGGAGIPRRGARFHGGAALLKGLLRLAAGGAAEALVSFALELALEGRGHLYAREASANSDAKGAGDLTAGERDSADAAFHQTLTRSRVTPRRMLDSPSRGESLRLSHQLRTHRSQTITPLRAERLVHANRVSDAMLVVSTALTATRSGNGGWLLAVAPLLRVSRAPVGWAPALVVLHLRALTAPASAHTRLTAALVAPAATVARLTSAHVVICFSSGGHSPQHSLDSPEQ